MRPRLIPLLLGVLAEIAAAQETIQHVGSVTFRVDTRFGHPGGLMVARLQSSRYLGTAFAILDGVRCPFYYAPDGPRAFVPIPVAATPGPATLGIEIRGRRGRQRIPLDVSIERRDYPSASLAIPPDKRSLLAAPTAVRDGRRLLEVLRVETSEAAWSESFEPPVGAAPGDGFGRLTAYLDAGHVESLMDSVHGEQHRGLDFPLPVGTSVQAPAGGTVLLAEHLTLTGETLALDHGQGVVSVFYHLSRLDVRVGERVAGRAVIALSGDTGLAAQPHLHWGVYVHGVAVDPQVLQALLP